MLFLLAEKFYLCMKIGLIVRLIIVLPVQISLLILLCNNICVGLNKALLQARISFIVRVKCFIVALEVCFS